MGERRNYIALDWVTAEIEETLQQARQSLDDYVSDREDITKLRFCLTYAHQVHGSLKMVELHGAALLAAELELLSQALVKDKVSDSFAALEALMTGFLQLSAYLHRLNTTHQDQPATLLPTLNELRAARGEEALSEAAVFNPDLQTSDKKAGAAKPAIKHDEFNALIRKIRQIYQAAMVGIVRDQEVEKNYSLLQKVCARLHKVSLGTASESLWKISHAVTDSLAAQSQPASIAIKTVLRQIDNEIKKLQENGRDVLEQQAGDALLKSLLYTVARAEPASELIRQVQTSYRLKEALPELDNMANANIALPDSETIRSVIDALNEELSSIQDVLDLYARGDRHSDDDIAAVLPAFQRVVNTLSVLGATEALDIIRSQQQRVEAIIASSAEVAITELVDIAAEIVSIQDALNRSKTIEDTRHLNIAGGQIDQAHQSVIREARNGLEQAKEAIIEFVASQWDVEPLKMVPGLLEAIRGGLTMVPLDKASKILLSCEQYVCNALLAEGQVPEWQMLDTLADAISSVEYYLECLSGDAKAELDPILKVAEESVATLGYPVVELDLKAESTVAEENADTTLSADTQEHSETPLEETDIKPSGEVISDPLDLEFKKEILEKPKADVIDLQSRQQVEVETASDVKQQQQTEDEIPANDKDLTPSQAKPEETLDNKTPDASTEAEEDDLVDDEIIEIFVEEATEVLETIAEYLPRWIDSDDKEALGEMRRAFHTLKGSGRMVGAIDIGELGWAIENMLNRLMDGTQQATPSKQQVIQQALGIIPDMVKAFETRQSIDLSAATSLMAMAEKLATGEEVTVTDLASESTPPANDDDEIVDDSALLDIFASEARAHSEVLKEYLLTAAKNDTDTELSDDLQRALHTLKGSAYMAEITPIATVVAPLERLIKELRGCQIKADKNILSLIDELQAFIQAGLAQLSSTPYQALSGGEAYAERVVAIHKERITELESSGQQEGVEPVVALLSDGMERLLHACDLISSWMEDSLSDEHLTQLVDDVTTLGEMSIKAGCTSINDITTNLTALYLAGQQHNVATTSITAGKSFFELLQQAHEHLIDMMDILAAGQSLPRPQSLLAELEEMQEALNTDDDSADTSIGTTNVPSNDVIAGILDDVDEETLEIFLEEASDLMESIDESLHQWLADRDSSEPVDELKRLLHTLKGGARLAGITPLGDLSHAYEAYIEQNSNFDEAFFAELRGFQDRLQTTMDLVINSEPSAAEGDVTIPLIDHPSEDEQMLDETVDPEVIEIFLEEANDLHEAIDTAAHSWINDRENNTQLEELKRLLHTLKGGARLAGMKALGNLSHNFETFLINAEQQNQISNDDFFAAIQNYQDQLATAMEDIVSSLQANAEAEQTDTTQASAALDATAQSDASEDAFADQLIETVDDNILPFEQDQQQLPTAPVVAVPPAAIEATRTFIDNFEKGQIKTRGGQEVVKVSAPLLQNLVNLAGETSISRGRVEEQISEMGYAIEEMDVTIDRLKGQLRRLEIETEAQILFRQEQVESEGMDAFDPLEMDRYSHFQQLARSLIESATDIQDVKETFNNKVRDMETLLLQQSRINSELQEGLMRSQMVPFSRMVPRLRRIVRQISTELGKQVDLRLENIEGELDRTVLERMVAPLEHMLRNAVDHGIESIEERKAKGKPAQGSITLGLAREGGEVVLTLSDDGAGINIEAVKEKAVERGLMEAGGGLSNHEILQFILHAGFSTATEVTQISGRGVGMDVVHSEIKQLGGVMDIQSERGHGSLFTVRLPFTVSVNRALMVCIGNDTYAIPLNTIEGIVRVSPYELEAYYQPDAPSFEYAGQDYDLRYMGSLLQPGARAKLEGQNMPLPVVLVRGSEHSVAVQVDRLLGSREIVVKTMGPQFSMVEGLSGATVLGDGSVVVILDLLAMIRADAARSTRNIGQGAGDAGRESEAKRNFQVMVVDDSVTVRKVTSRFLERQGVEVVLAKDGVDAMAKLLEADVLPDVMLLDIEMPRMDGFEVASRIRHSERLEKIPIIMITSRTGDKHRERALSLGVDKYMGKPYQETELLATISELIGEEIG